MFRMKSVYTIAALALALSIASLAQAQTSATPATPASPAKPATHAAKHTTMAKVDLNTASKDELMKLSGVTDEIAEKIIAARPFKTKSELVSKKLVTRAEYAKLATHVTAKAESKK